MTATRLEVLPLCARCRGRIVGAVAPSPQRDFFGAGDVVHAGPCPPREPHLELLVRRDTDEGSRFRRRVEDVGDTPATLVEDVAHKERANELLEGEVSRLTRELEQLGEARLAAVRDAEAQRQRAARLRSAATLYGLAVACDKCGAL